MTRAQISALNMLTNRIRNINYDGAVTFKVQDAGRGAKWLMATNGESNLRWYETHVFVMALIGTRGGITIKHAEGLKAKWLK